MNRLAPLPRAFGLYCALALASACARHTPAGTGGEPVQPTVATVIATQVESQTVVAGTPFTVHCSTRSGNVVVPEITRVQVSAPNATERREGGGHQVVVELAGPISVHCATADGRLFDDDGVTLEVVAASLAAIETMLDTATAVAGVGVGLECVGRDAFGNAALMPDLRVIHESSVEVVDDLAPRFRVHATRAGTYGLACTAAGVSDATPAMVAVVPGAAAWSVTTVDADSVPAMTWVNAACHVTDLFGNSINDTASALVVMSDVAQVRTDLLEVDGLAFRSPHAGLHLLFCIVPGLRAGDESPAYVDVVAGPPADWTVHFEENECHHAQEPLPLRYDVVDRYDNPLPDAQVTLRSEPEGATLDARGRVRVPRDGAYVLTLEVVGPYDSAMTPQPFEAALHVDSTPPRITFTSPSRGDMVRAGRFSDSSMWIEGHVEDDLSALGAVKILDEPIDATSAGIVGFKVAHTSRWGLNIVTATAQDACGNQTDAAMSFLRSPSFAPASTAVNVRAQTRSGLGVHLGQRLLDDGNRSDIDDFATLAQRSIAAVDLNAQLPPGHVLVDQRVDRHCGGFFQSSGYWGRPEYAFILRRALRGQLRMGDPYVRSLRAVNGGMGLDIALEDLSLPFEIANIRSHSCEFGVPSSIGLGSYGLTLSARRVSAAGRLGLALSASGPDASLNPFDLTLEGLDIDVGCAPIIDWICDAAADVAVFFARDAITDAVENALAQQLPPAMEGLLGGLELATGFDLPAPLDMRLNLASGLDRLSFTGARGGYGEMGLYTQVYPSSAASAFTESRGAIRRGGQIPAPRQTQSAFGVALKDDLVNQIFWALWYGGALEQPDLEDLIASSGNAFAGVSLDLNALLPPVLMPGRDGHNITLGLGGLAVRAQIDVAQLLGSPEPSAQPLVVHLFASMRLPGDLGVNDGGDALSLSLDDDSEVAIEVTSINLPQYQHQVSALLSNLLRVLLPGLLNQALGAFPLPTIDVGSVGGLRDVVWGLDAPEIHRPQGGAYTLLEGDIKNVARLRLEGGALPNL